ncbi:MAG TPA: hypothetical protein DC005_01600 [Proteobacteria bacterium]|nr:hypothetical protein [Pseudomonadota bacterium]
MATPATQPTVTVYFDFICPFCYLGGLRLRRLQQRWGFDLAWEGIQIHPETPRTGAPIARFGDELLRRAASGIVALAEEEGVEINLPLTLANSGLAHRMAELARREGCLDAYLERTFHAYFQEGRDLGDNQTVPAIVRALGIPRPAIGATPLPCHVRRHRPRHQLVPAAHRRDQRRPAAGPPRPRRGGATRPRGRRDRPPRPRAGGRGGHPPCRLRSRLRPPRGAAGGGGGYLRPARRRRP